MFDFRRPDFKDPPYEPSKLFRVRRITKSLKGLPWWERKILEGFKLDGKVCFYVSRAKHLLLDSFFFRITQ